MPTARQIWVTELQDEMNKNYKHMIPYDDHLTPMENQRRIKSAWETLKQDGNYEIEFFGDLLMQAISRGTRKQILIFNTNMGSPNDPIVVVRPEQFGGVSDSTVPVVVAYNGVHFESLHPVGEENIEKTKDLCQQYLAGQYTLTSRDIERMTKAYTGSEKVQRSRDKNPKKYELAKKKVAEANKQRRINDPKKYTEEKKKKAERRIEDPKKYTEEKKKIVEGNKQRRIEDPKKYTEEKKKTVERRRERNEKKFIEELNCDTGFESICAVCAEVKSKTNTVNIDCLDEADVINYASLSDKTKELDGSYSVCTDCRKSIDKKETPKKSQNLSLFEFPKDFLDHVLKMLSSLDGVTSLNKLEGFLLKLCIPFIRICHCPRGPYVQVKGSLILISSDVKHSLEKILPLPQQIVPVKFKRKLSYDGHYIGEYVDKQKVRMFFEFFKKHNHLFKDVSLDCDVIDELELELDSEADTIYNASTGSEEATMAEEQALDDLEDEIDLLAEEQRDPDDENDDNSNSEDAEVVPAHQQNSTMFMNKYEEDTNAFTVANRLARLICHLEKEQVLTVDPLEEVDLDHLNDEWITNAPNDELYASEDETSWGDNDSDNDSDYMPADDGTEESESEIEYDSCASISSDNDTNSESETPNEQAQGGVENLARLFTKRASEKMTAVCVDPGEGGEIVNWREDVYVEEKCFPELFPFGCGGYLSTCLSTGKNIGFANYARQKIKCADPRFRDNQVKYQII